MLLQSCPSLNSAILRRISCFLDALIKQGLAYYVKRTRKGCCKLQLENNVVSVLAFLSAKNVVCLENSKQFTDLMTTFVVHTVFFNIRSGLEIRLQYFYCRFLLVFS